MMQVLSGFRFLKKSLVCPMVTLCVLGMMGGIPFFLTGSTLVFWLQESGFTRAQIGLFGLVGLPYACNFLWAPFLDCFSLSSLIPGGQRRAWVLVSQVAVIFSIFLVSVRDPVHHFMPFIASCILLAFSAATHGLSVEACQMELCTRRQWGYAEASCILGYRLGMLASGAGALFLSTFLPWSVVYQIMGCLCILLFFLTFLLLPKNRHAASITLPHGTFWDRFKHMVADPLGDFFSRQRWPLIFLFIMVFRLEDYLMGQQPNLFFLEMGFAKDVITRVYKIFGTVMFLLGGFCAGAMIRSWGYRRTLFIGSIFHGLSALVFSFQASTAPHLETFYVAVGIEEWTRGLSMTAFFSYQLTCCRLRFAMTQLAILTALATLILHIFGATSGFLSTALGWPLFFGVAALACLPGTLILFFLPIEKIGQESPSLSR